MSPRKPGLGFWIHVRLADLFSPGSGSHRINARLREAYEDGQGAHVRNSALTEEVKFLRRELFRVQGENNMFHVQDAINLVGTSEPSFVNKKLPTSTSSKRDSAAQPFHDHKSHGQRFSRHDGGF